MRMRRESSVGVELLERPRDRKLHVEHVGANRSQHRAGLGL